MTGTSILQQAIVILFTLLPVCLNAQSVQLVHNLDKLNGVPKGKTLELNVSYTYGGSKVVVVTWKFKGDNLVSKLGTVVQGDNPRATIRGNATLVLTNTELSDNGTYTIEVGLFGVTPSDMASFEVIIQVPPKAKVTCFGKGDAVSCLCEGIGGNPPAYATWLKGNTKIKGREYLSTTLDKNDIISNKEGEYTCKANSDGPTDEANVTLSKPNKILFESRKVGGKTQVVCQVVGSVTPAPVYLISFNGSEAKEYENGVKDIGKVDFGQYECLAKNVLGNVTKHLFYNGTAMKVASTPKTPTGQSSSSSSDPSKVGTDGEGDSGGLGTGAIVGIVVGVLFLIVVVVALVYWFCIKQNECCCACCVLGGKDDRSEDDRSQNENPAEGYVKEDNPYASVDEERERPDKGASTSRNQARPAAEMPPVYAAVDKTKKNKKPPPDAQPALTYASLDPVILQPDSSKMRDRSREETNYAAIDLEKLQSDLV